MTGSILPQQGASGERFMRWIGQGFDRCLMTVPWQVIGAVQPVPSDSEQYLPTSPIWSRPPFSPSDIYLLLDASRRKNEEGRHYFGRSCSCATTTSFPERVDCRRRGPVSHVVWHLRTIRQRDEQRSQHHQSLQLSHFRLLDVLKRQRLRGTDRSRRSDTDPGRHLYRRAEPDWAIRPRRGLAELSLTT